MLTTIGMQIKSHISAALLSRAWAHKKREYRMVSKMRLLQASEYECQVIPISPNVFVLLPSRSRQSPLPQIS